MPLGRQTVAMMIISSAASNPQFAQIDWTKYLQPRRQTFAIVVERAKARTEIPDDLDSDWLKAISGGRGLWIERLLPCDVDEEFPIAAPIAMFPDVDSLPGAED